MSEIFSVLADPTRRAILVALTKKPQSVSDLVAATGEGQPTVSKHLKTLREAGLVTVEAAGQARVYSIATAPLAEATAFLNQLNPSAKSAGAATASTGKNSSEQEAAAGETDLPKILGEAGEKLGGLLAAGATWLNSQIAAKLADANVDPNKMGKDLGRKLADAKLAATDTAASAEAQLKSEITELSAKLGAKVAEVKDSVLPNKAETKPAAKPAAKSTSAKKAPATKTAAAKKPAAKSTAAKTPAAKKPETPKP
jgi:DNA-binding transcriptional ArsR family regulator